MKLVVGSHSLASSSAKPSAVSSCSLVRPPIDQMQLPLLAHPETSVRVAGVIVGAECVAGGNATGSSRNLGRALDHKTLNILLTQLATILLTFSF